MSYSRFDSARLSLSGSNFENLRSAADVAPPKFMDFYASSMLPNELFFAPDWDIDNSLVRKPSNFCAQEPKLGNHKLSRQVFADKVQTSIENLQLLHDKLVEKSEGLPQSDEVQNQSLEGSESWPWMSSQECVTAESPGSRVEEGGESEYNGGKRSASNVDLEDLLSSLQTLLSVLKSHEENEQILRAKMQVLREKKQALHEEKQQYKRQRGSRCRSQVWLAERE